MLPANAPQFVGQWGSVVFRYNSLFMRNLYAVAMVHDDGYPIAFHLDAVTQPENWKNGGREGVWWLPNASAMQYLVLTNQSGRNLPVVLTIYDAAGKAFSQKLQLTARGTLRISVRDLVKQAGISGSYGGLRVDADGVAGSLDTTSFVFDEAAAFGAALKMFDRNPETKLEERDFAKTGKWTTRAPMLALSTPDPFLGFPTGTVLQPQILLRNTTSKSLRADLGFNWRAGTTTGKVPLPELTLAPNETRSIDIKAMQDAGIIPAAANWAAVSITSNGHPDDLIAVASSYDATLRYGAQTPFSDQLSIHMEGGEWQVDATHNSLIAAGNGSTVPIRAALTIFYNQGQGSYTLERALQPEEQMGIDMGQLIRNRIPDKEGKVLPADLTSGTYQLMELGAMDRGSLGSLYEGKVIIDKTFGHAAYGCMICCGISGGTFSPDPWSGAVSFTSPGNVVTYDACSGIGPEGANGYYSTWWTNNTAIATSSPHLINGIGPGSTGNFARGTIPDGAGQGGRTCPTRLDTASSTANVSPAPDHVSVVLDNLGFPSACPSTGIYARQMKMQVVDSSGTGVVFNPAIQEGFTNETPNTCGNGSPVPSSCAVTGLNGIVGQFLDTMSVSGNFCGSGIQQSSSCGFNLTSTWSLCSGSGTANLWGSPRITHSNSVTVNGSSTAYKPGTQFH